MPQRANQLSEPLDAITDALSATVFSDQRTVHAPLDLPGELKPNTRIKMGVLEFPAALPADARENLRRADAAHAPAAWTRINMFGECGFSDEKLRDVLGILLLKSAVLYAARFRGVNSEIVKLVSERKLFNALNFQTESPISLCEDSQDLAHFCRNTGKFCQNSVSIGNLRKSKTIINDYNSMI